MQFRLTSSQRNFYNKNFTLDSQIWNQGVMEIFPCVYSYEQLNNAYNKLVETHESLRVKLVETENGVVADVRDHEYKNYRFWQVESESELMQKAQDFLNEPTDRYGLLVDCAVFQTPVSSGIMINAHHIVVDGFSAFVMSEHINGFLKDADFAPVIQKYADYVEKEEKYKQSRRYAKSQEFWLREFSEKPECSIFSMTENMLDFTSAEMNRVISADLFGRIRTICDKYEITPASFFNAVNAIYLHKKYEIQNFTIGVPVFNRTTADELNTIGLYMHLVPLVISLGNDSFIENAKRIEDSKMNLFRHQSFTQQDIKSLLAENKFPVNQLFDVVSDYQEFSHNNEYEMRILYGNSLSVPIEMHLQTFDEIDHNLKIRYRTAFFSETDIGIMLNSIFAIAEDAAENPEKIICDLETVSDAEKKILDSFNNTSVTYASDSCVHELFESQAEKTPARIAITGCDKVLTYSELNAEANAIAHSLTENGIGNGDIVAFRLSRKTSLVSSMLGILKTGAAYLPIDPDYPEDRTEYMLSDSGAKYCITDKNVEALLKNENTENPEIRIDNSSVCYCIYTSGSTGKPKGTLLTHKNVVNYVSANEKNVCFGITKENTKILSVTTAGFDIFVTETLLPLANGMEIILANEEQAKLQHRLTELLENNPADIIQTTPTKMKSLMTDKSDLDYLKNFRAIILGGETLDAALVKELKDCTDAEIYNIYGPTEATVWVTYAKAENEEITIGKPMANTQIHIVDKYMKLVPAGVTGELCIAGDCVAKGYLNRDELTNEKFIDNPFGNGKLYKTGDLAYRKADGNIVFIGRNDFQVKIRGQRIELGEIENAIAETDGIIHTVVTVRKDKTDRQLICAFYTGTEKTAREIKEAINSKLPKYMIPHVFTHLEEMPLTSSGKINRNALPGIDLENISTDTEYVEPETENEILLTECIAKVLGKEKISVIDNFFDIGGDSLKTIELTAKLEEKGKSVTVRTIFSSRDIRELATFLEEKENTEEAIEYGKIIPATPAQMRVYTAQMMKPDSTLYNITYAFRTENVDREKLEKAVNNLIARHESLRTHFENIDGVIHQVIDGNATVKAEEINEANLNSFAKPFSLEKSPLIRVGCNENTVAIDIHHIIADGETMPVLFRELNDLYMDRELSETVQYGEFAVQNTDTQTSEKYWLDVFSEEVPELNLPTDFTRKSVQSFGGKTHYSRIEKTLHEKIEEKCRQKGITPFVYYMACFSILLSKLSGNEDIVIGTPISGRTGRYLDTVGMFVNTIALRNRPEGNKKTEELFNEIRDNSIEAIDNQNYPFGDLVNKLNIQTKGRNPLFDVMLAYQSAEMTDVTFADKKAELIPLETTSAKCDMTFNILPRTDDVVIAAEYCTDLFSEEKIADFAEMYKTVLELCLAEETEIKDISVADEKVLAEFNSTETSYASDRCVHELFELQAEKTPDSIAITGCDKVLTYRELNAEANKIAHSLIGKGIGNGDIVAFRLSRKTSLVSSMLGILKTGAAYLPIDPDYPEDRTEYMLSDSGAKYCITDENVEALLKNSNKENPEIRIDNSSVCYCIYTSGSTGKPKGTLLTHRNVVNYVSANEKNVCFGITKESKRILSVTTAGFDIFVTETLLPLANGMEIILANEEQAKLQSRLTELLENNPADIIQTTPTKMKSLMTDKSDLDYLKNFSAIILGGEALDTALVSELRSITDAEIYNIYGPTEATVWVTYAKAENEEITIGKPMANTQIHIVDKYMKLVPVGVTGELCIAGDCVAKGYLNRDELTNEKFIENPFGNGKLYRTGDLAYRKADGNIVFIGRNDFQVKIRGQRIELGEIENAIAETDGIIHTVVTVRKDKTDRQLICAFYTGTEKTAREIKEAINSKLPKYMLPHVFTHLEEMPLTSSGKINRNALPEIDLENISTDTEYVEPETENEILLTECIAKVLGKEKISVIDNFFDIGGDSLKAIELTAKLEEKGKAVTVRTIFSSRDIRELATFLEEKENTEEAIEYGKIIPATPAQMRVYTAQMMKPDSTLYNITYAFRTENVDREKLGKAVNNLIARHESLRTHFENIDGTIHQVIDEEKIINVETITDADLNSFAKPFDLSESPLIRVGCNENTVAIDIHHIIADGETMPVLFRELNELYMDRELNKTVQYGEFAVQNTDTQTSEKYWLDVFAEEVPELNLPTDYTRKTVQSFGGKTHYSRIEKTLHEKIEEKCRQKGITPFVYYMACFSILLSKLSGNEDIVIGTPISGRTGRYLETVGMFVNTIALRNRPEGNKKIEELFNEIRDNSIEAIDNQNYPFGDLVSKLNMQTKGRNPLFDVMLAYQSAEMTDVTYADKKAELIPLETTAAKCDMTFNILPRTDDVVLAAEYCTDLFSEETVQRFADRYKFILEQCLEENISVKDISVMTEAEKQHVVYGLNDTAHEYDVEENSTIYSLFEETAKNKTTKTCVTADGKSVTFGELLTLSESLDSRIREITNDEKSIIAVIAERSIEMYAGIYGIIRGGNAYMPIAPDYPQERIEYMLKNSNAAAVVAQGKFTHLAGDVPCIDMTEFIKEYKNEHIVHPCNAEADDTAYVIYTSGSTGKPKGAKVSHRSAVNRILWMHDKYPIEGNDVILQKTPYTFDVSVWELFWWGMVGGSLAASRPDEHFLPAKILEEVYNNNVTHLHFVPSVFELFLNYLETHKEEQYKFNTVRYVFLSGEALTANHINRFYGMYDFNKVHLHNLYGPTECAVDVTYYDCVPGDTDPVPIGKPIYNTQMHVVDKYMNPVPVGVTGELCIAGVNVGQGYLNNPELTNEKFLQNPFGKGKLYKTGDNAYVREDGEIIFCGRIDNQIKLNGQRIEIGEIESVIGKTDGVESVAVILRKVNGRDILAAFWCGEESAEKAVRDKCETELPAYMVPGAFCRLNEMPLNPSGKLDRKALSAIEIIEVKKGEYEKPENDTECYIAEVFGRILGVEKIGRNSDFFELGGTSLSMISLLSEDFFKDVSAAGFISNSTPRKLAGLMTAETKNEVSRVMTLKNIENSRKALVFVPYAGGGAEAFAALSKSLSDRTDEYSLYYVDYARSSDECEKIAQELYEVAKDCELYVYSHCAGSAVAMQIITNLEKMQTGIVVQYIAGASIPPEKPQKDNFWNTVSDEMLVMALMKAGAPFGSFSDEQIADMVMNFRKDTDFMTECFYKERVKVRCPVSVIISKDDMFTENFADAERLWNLYAENVVGVHFIDTKTHYFQSDNSNELADIMLSVLSK